MAEPRKRATAALRKEAPKYKLGSRMKDWFENHPIWVLLSIAAFLVSTFIAAEAITLQGINFYKNYIGWKAVEQNKIDQLAPMETVEYFNSVLGQPILKKANQPSLPPQITEYIYREKAYWVAAYSDTTDTVQLMAITACGNNGFYPQIKNNPVGGTITLGRTKMKYAALSDSYNTWGKPSTEFTPHYYLAGASAPTFLYDEYYYGGPSRYQTVYMGNNALCGSVSLPSDIRQKLNTQMFGTNALSASQVSQLRSSTVVNTFAVTAPDLSYSIFSNGSYDIGVSYIDAGILKPQTFSRRP